jgi:hypothetical protein
MPIDSTTIHRFTCSIKDCRESRTVGGELSRAIDEMQRNQGWLINVVFIKQSVDLCPQHAKEVIEWAGLK